MRTTLKKDEKLLGIFKLHWLYFIFPIIYATIFFIAFFLFNKTWLLSFVTLFIIWFFYKLLKYLTSSFIVTDNRVIGEYGILSSNFDETPLNKINNVTYSKPILGQIFNYGKVIIQSGATKGESGITFVANPKALRDMISDLIDKHDPSKVTQPKIVETKFHTVSNNISFSDEIMKLNDLKEKGIINEAEFLKAKERLLENK